MNFRKMFRVQVDQPLDNSTFRKLSNIFITIAYLPDMHHEQFVSLTTIFSVDILQYGADCYDAVLTKSALTSCDFDRTPMKDYVPDLQRCQ